MCLTCAFREMTKENKEKLFKFKGHYLKTRLRTPDNKIITLNNIFLLFFPDP